MLAIHIIICFAVIFIAGMHYALWDNGIEPKSIYFTIGLGAVGIYNLISIVGYVSRTVC